MKSWKLFALASVALNLGILVAVGLFWLRSAEDNEYDEWLAELALTEEQEDRMFTLIDSRFEIADQFFEGLDPKIDDLITLLGTEQPDATVVQQMLSGVERERGQLSRQMNAELVAFLLTLKPEQRVETLFFMLEAEDLALWFF